MTEGVMSTPFSRRNAAIACAMAAFSLAAPQAMAQASLVELVKASKPSVVAVGVYNATSAPRFTFRGTGFVVADGNLVATNAHVLPDPEDKTFGNQLHVRVVAGPTAPDHRVASVYKLDRARDVAVLRIEGPPLPVLDLAGEALADEGTPIALMGFPIGGQLGMIPVTHRGLLSSVANVVMPTPSARQLNERAVMQLREGAFSIYQLDATAYPGNSGGPVFNAGNGKVIGIMSMVLAKGSREVAMSNPSGISYAVPIRHLIELLKSP